jgi:hypothetical protein
MKQKRFLICIAALCAALPAIQPAPLAAQSQLGFFGRGSILFFPEDNGSASAPMPILPSLGGGVFYTLNDLLALEASLDIYGTSYDYNYSLGRAVPANDEHRSAFVTGLLLGLQPVFRWNPLGDKFTVRAYGGLSFDLRMIFSASGIDDDDPHTNGYTVGDARSEITSYFWGGGRFVFLHAGGGMDFPILDNSFQLGFDLRIWFPIWRIWSGENLPGIEGFRFGAGLRITF